MTVSFNVVHAICTARWCAAACLRRAEYKCLYGCGSTAHTSCIRRFHLHQKTAQFHFRMTGSPQRAIRAAQRARHGACKAKRQQPSCLTSLLTITAGSIKPNADRIMSTDDAPGGCMSGSLSGCTMRPNISADVGLGLSAAASAARKCGAWMQPKVRPPATVTRSGSTAITCVRTRQ